MVWDPERSGVRSAPASAGVAAQPGAVVQA
jgi:hypothetical protein